MAHLIDKDAIIAEIEKIIPSEPYPRTSETLYGAEIYGKRGICFRILDLINTLEVKNSYEQCVQYDSIKAGIQAHAETYSFNIKSELFNQLTKEQQALWRKEIEQACISGGYDGVELARDPRYKEDLDVKEVDLEKEIISTCRSYRIREFSGAELDKHDIEWIAKHFFELGVKTKGK